MRSAQLEAWALDVTQRVKRGAIPEDDRVQERRRKSECLLRRNAIADHDEPPR